MPTSGDAYLQLIRSGLQRLYETHDEETESWRQTIDPHSRSFDPPAHIVSTALVEAFLCRHDNDDGLARKAIERLSDLQQFADMFAKITADRSDPHIEPNLNIFTLPPYCDAYRLVRDHSAMTPSRRDLIEGSIAASTKASLQFPEWGLEARPA